ncbi:hypothetical protein [uncultured Sphingomonas sp.]|uniref:hypothetical protein n=1 Tax=uncultured Sphingomonas sp. TaxID=158754 RepID=UPI0035CAAD8D
MKAYMEIDGGSTWQGQAVFDVQPAVGDYIAFGKGRESGSACVVAIEHREQVDGFVSTVIAKTKARPYNADWNAL